MNCFEHERLFYRNKVVLQTKPNTGYDSGIRFLLFYALFIKLSDT